MKHLLKFGVGILGLGAFLILVSCAGAPPLTAEEVSQEKATLDSLFLRVKQDISLGNAKGVFDNLSSDSKDWFVSMRMGAQSESVNFLVSRPFFEILTILSLRVERRLHPELSDDLVDILQRTVLKVPVIRKNFVKHPTGEFTVYQYKAEVGLKKTPAVPVFFFAKEEKAWKMDLVKTLPLILLGVEGIARNFKSEPIQQAIYVIENVLGQKVLAEDLRP